MIFGLNDVKKESLPDKVTEILPELGEKKKIKSDSTS